MIFLTNTWSFFLNRRAQFKQNFVHKNKWSKSCHDNTAFTEHNYGDQCKKSNKNKTEENYIWKKKKTSNNILHEKQVNTISLELFTKQTQNSWKAFQAFFWSYQ